MPPRLLETPAGGCCYHVLNRGNAHTKVFHKEADFQAFLEILAEASLRRPMRLLAYCLIPNHFPPGPLANPGRRPEPVHALATDHSRCSVIKGTTTPAGTSGKAASSRFQSRKTTISGSCCTTSGGTRCGRAWRLGAEDWPWSSLKALSDPSATPVQLDPGPRTSWVPSGSRPCDATMFEAEVEVRPGIDSPRPGLGDPTWTLATAANLGLDYSLHPRGRPPRSGTE